MPATCLKPLGLEISSCFSERDFDLSLIINPDPDPVVVSGGCEFEDADAAVIVGSM